MTTIINASTVSGLVNSADTSGILQLQTASTAALTIDASQNVGIGTASPTQKLQVAGNAFISAGQYFMWDNAGAWSLQSDASTYVRTYIAGNEKMRVNAYGIGVGGAIPSSGTGVTFPATQSASSDANTLDDYEEGTWTPTGGGLTNNATAYYTKVGRLVQAICDVTLPGGGAATQAQINGLPFTNLTPGGGGSIGYTTYTSAITLNIERSTTYFVFVSFGGANLTFANLNGVRLIVTLVYSV